MNTTSRTTTRLARATVAAGAAAALAGFGAPGLDAASASGAPATVSRTAPYCGIYWGSLPKSGGHDTISAITGIRTGRHACFDRLVIDLLGAATPRYSVEYVGNVYADGSGDLVPLRGGAKLRIIAVAPDYDVDYSQVTYDPANPSEAANVSGYATFRQVAFAGSYEGQSTIGLGVRARLPFRVFALSGPAAGTTRLVVDVAHFWS